MRCINSDFNMARLGSRRLANWRDVRQAALPLAKSHCGSRTGSQLTRSTRQLRFQRAKSCEQPSYGTIRSVVREETVPSHPPSFISRVKEFVHSVGVKFK